MRYFNCQFTTRRFKTAINSTTIPSSLPQLITRLTKTQKMRNEVSAGGVVYKNGKGGPLILLLKDKNNNWTFPKGLIESQEDKIGTAKREIEEEVGLKEIALVDELPPIDYWYKREVLIKKRVYYFLFKLKGKEKPKPQKEEGIKEAKWFRPKMALQAIGYQKTNEMVLKEAIKKIENLK